MGGGSLLELHKRILADKLIFRMIKEKIKSLISKEKTKVYIIWSASKTVMESKWCFPTRKIQFEGMEVSTFQCIESYLKEHYGNEFLQDPADELRRVGIHRIEF